MATNEVFWDANRVSLKVGAGTLAGDPVRVGNLNAVAITDSSVSNSVGTNIDYALTSVGAVNKVPTGNEVGWASCKTTGAFRIATNVTTSVAIGDPIYAIVNGTGSVKKVALTNVVGTNKFWGVALEDAAAGAAVKLAVKIAEITA